ncbi:acyl carrier protein [Ureaplasma diversum]|uniref:Acyl carrier protein n=2 Tax=Ureaplasma diversum TaxID=42094 RepID=A0A084EZM4_9BACT|nr:acyl carrier protein [Ureaplasma diversum]AJQ45213.1 acyl carrier protein [Ureaplasma diversum]KEZ23416.1 Acyl carrier protein [Ureaplasma diversum NCTC 246]
MNIEAIIKQVANEHKINLDMNNKNVTLKDIGIDSLAAMNLIMKVEDKVGFQLDDSEILKIRTLGDLIRAFEQH